MSKLLIPILFIACCLYYACNNDCSPIIIGSEELLDFDTCNGINPVACSFSFREGKWVEIQDSISMIFIIADTIWFKEDSLIAWSNDDGSYTNYVGYFTQNLLYKQTWNGQPDDPVYPSGTYTTYNDSTEVFRIHWNFGEQPIDYIKLD